MRREGQLSSETPERSEEREVNKNRAIDPLPSSLLSGSSCVLCHTQMLVNATCV